MPQSERWTRKDSKTAASLIPPWNVAFGTMKNAPTGYGKTIDYYPRDPCNTFKSADEAFQHVLLLALTGDKLAIKALRIVVTKNPGVYGEYSDAVKALTEQYGE